jgi:hypothetical protein
MKKTSTILLLSFLLSLGLFSCGKETQSTTQGGGVFKVRITIDPPLQSGMSATSGFNLVTIQVASALKSWSGTQQTAPLSTFETDEISVTSGQNVQFFISQFINLYDRNCRSVKYEAIQNGKINETHTLSLGYNGTLSCADGMTVSKNFIIK